MALPRLSAPIQAARVTSGWGSSRAYRATAENPNPTHEGLDWTAAVGTPVLAMADGVVVRVVDTPDTWAGRYVRLDHGGGLVTEYLHLGPMGLPVVGQRAARGERLGYSGTSGINGDGSVVPHLHTTARASGPALLEYRQRFGAPTAGYGHTNNGGTAVPLEPLVPAYYSSGVLGLSASLGISTIQQMKGSPPRDAASSSRATGGVLVAALGLAAGVMWGRL